MDSRLTGVEGLRHLATEYLDAINAFRGFPDARLVGNAIRAGRNFEIGTKVVQVEEDMFRELFMRFGPYERKGRALAQQA